MLAYYLHNLSPFVFEVRGIGPRWYGLAYVAAFLSGFWLYRWLAERRYTEMRPAQVGDFITWAALFGVIVGGRLGWVLFYAWRDVLADPAQLLQVWKGGMSSHGGILGLVLFTFWYAWRHRLSWTSIGDNLCVVAPIGLFLVRCANFINGELYGRPANVPWSMQFPAELYDRPDLWPKLGVGSPEEVTAMVDAARTNPDLTARMEGVLTPRHPSQLYEAFLEGAVLFAALWFLRTRVRVPRGVLTGAFFILYAVLRIFGEVFREPDSAWAVGSFSAGQFLSLFMIAIGAAFVVWGFRTRQYEPAQMDATSPPAVTHA